MVKQFTLKLISGMLAALLFASNAQAQVGDWQVVQKLKPETLISVKAGERYSCSFQKATLDALTCRPVLHRLTKQPATLTIPRREVRQVRLEPNQAKHGWIGAGIGAGVGAAVGASRSTGPRRGRWIAPALGGALVGGVIGLMVSIFRRGKIIYKA